MREEVAEGRDQGGCVRASGTGRVRAAPGQRWGPRQLFSDSPGAADALGGRGWCGGPPWGKQGPRQTGRALQEGLMEGRGFGSLFYGHMGMLDAWGDSRQRRFPGH